jgi:hypothetical protein
MHLSPLSLSRILSDTCSERVSPGYQDELNGQCTMPKGNWKDLGIASMAEARRVNSAIAF